MLCFSGTGNSVYIAKGFSQRMGAGCHSIEEDADFDLLLGAHNTVAVSNKVGAVQWCTFCAAPFLFRATYTKPHRQAKIC